MKTALRAIQRDLYGTLDPALIYLPLYAIRLRNHRVMPGAAGDYMARTEWGWLVGDPADILTRLPHHGTPSRR